MRAASVLARSAIVLPAIVLPAVLLPTTAVAHPGRAPAPHDLRDAWVPDAWPLVLLAASAVVYARGVHRLWRYAGRGRGVSRWRAHAGGGGVLVLAVALGSPLDAVSEALFFAHMVQHLLLMLVAAPLLAASRPGVAAPWALARGPRLAFGRWWARRRSARRVAAAVRSVPAATALHSLALWAWHVPALYDAATRDALVHALEHASFLGTAVLFWWPVVAPGAAGRRAPGRAIAAVFALAMQSAALGAILAVAREPWYTAHLATSAPWGLMPLEDQQAAGALMWGPAGLAYLVAMVVLVARWLRAAERSARTGSRDDRRASRPAGRALDPASGLPRTSVTGRATGGP